MLSIILRLQSPKRLKKASSKKVNIVFILQYDTAVKTFVPVMQAMHDKGHRVECFAVQESHKKKWITPEIQKMLCGFAYCIGTVYGAAHKIKSDTDAVVMGFGNRRYMRVIYRHIKTNKLQAKTVNGYVGVILSTHERPFQENILVRSKSSLIFCPGATAYRKIMDTGLCRATGCKVVNTGLPRFDALCEQKKNIGFSDVRDKILFVEQPTFPESYEERLDMCEKLVELANKNRSKKVVIKPRFKELCGHAHEPRFLLPDIISGMVDVPENLTFDYRNIYEILARRQLRRFYTASRLIL